MHLTEACRPLQKLNLRINIDLLLTSIRLIMSRFPLAAFSPFGWWQSSSSHRVYWCLVTKSGCRYFCRPKSHITKPRSKSNAWYGLAWKNERCRCVFSTVSRWSSSKSWLRSMLTLLAEWIKLWLIFIVFVSESYNQSFHCVFIVKKLLLRAMLNWLSYSKISFKLPNTKLSNHFLITTLIGTLQVQKELLPLG